MRSHRELAALAERQYGVVTFVQLRRLGFSKGAIGRASRAGRLHRVHRGVYAVGHAVLPRRGRCLAAVLACGGGAVLSHSSAGWLWGLVTELSAIIHVTVPRSGGNRHPGISLHHSSTLVAVELGRLAGIPVTTVPRTVLDVAATGRARELSDVVERASRRDLLALDALDATLVRHVGERGVARLRQATDIYRDPVFSRARSERLFLAMVKAAGLPRPAINTWIDKFEIDAYWASERFAVEVDGWEAHRTRRAFEHDHRRWEEMKVADIEVVPISARRIETRPREVGDHLRILLERRRAEINRRN
ncbi:MAG: type IV toxin-antitoxin system AbiEi family antitoxin domain-containing protein [Solirubrobacterales bacterium]